MYFRFFKLHLGSKRSAGQPKAIYSEVPKKLAAGTHPAANTICRPHGHGSTMSVDPAHTFLHQGTTNTSGHPAAFCIAPSISKKYCASFQLQSISVVWIIAEKIHSGKRLLKKCFFCL
ncbi:MAG: hypothetical protein MR636_08250 [Clostridiales bacterium]|nr:hypothetical protein [Clostridiales bacterium]